MMSGAPYVEACDKVFGQLGEEQAVTFAGAMLGRWLSEGIVEKIA